jgi:hypothetical protein
LITVNLVTFIEADGMFRLDRSQLERAFVSGMQVLKRLLQTQQALRRRKPRMGKIRKAEIRKVEIAKV